MSLLLGRAPRSVRSFLSAAGVLAGAVACGGGGGGDVTPPPPANTTVTVNVAAQLVVAPTTTGLSLQARPAYELAAGGTRALPAPAAVALTAASTQTVPVTVDLTSCLNDAGRAGAASGGTASCRVVIEYTLLSGTRVVDTQTSGTFVVAGGSASPTSAVTFTEVTGVRVTNASGTVLADAAAVRAEVGTTVTLTASALRADGATSGRAVTWSSDNPAVAQVNATTGVITPVGPGQARITATAGDARSAVVVTVVAAPANVAVTVAGGGGNGTVTSTPAGINCRVTAGTAGSTCSVALASDAQVTLTAAPDAGSTFGGWGGDCASAGTALQCTLAASNGVPRNVTVRFNAQRTLTVSLAGSGAGRVTSVPAGIDCSPGVTAGCTATFVEGQSVVLTAAAVTNSTFTGWSGAGCSGTEPCTVTIGQNAVVTATFAGTPNPVPFTVAVNKPAGDAATYAVDLVYTRVLNGAPDNSGLFTFRLSTANPAPQFTLQADEGTQVTLTVRVAPGFSGQIVSWGGVCAGTAVTTPNASCTFRQTPNAAVVLNVGP